jgi:hypothetical protein
MPAKTTSKHGTYARYNNQNCRCSRCKVANADHQKDYRRRVAKLTAVSEYGTH